MNGLFGFDLKKMSDDELLERWHTLSRRIVWAGRFGSMEMVGQLQTLQNSIMLEQRERLLEQRARARAAMPTVLVETDPDLAADYKAEVAAAAEKETKKAARPNILKRDRPDLSAERIRPTPQPNIDGERKK